MGLITVFINRILRILKYSDGGGVTESSSPGCILLLSHARPPCHAWIKSERELLSNLWRLVRRDLQKEFSKEATIHQNLPIIAVLKCSLLVYMTWLSSPPRWNQNSEHTHNKLFRMAYLARPSAVGQPSPEERVDKLWGLPTTLSISKYNIF
jgi:hypothetical protein